VDALHLSRWQLEQLLQRVRRDADYAARLNARFAELGVPTSVPLAGAANHASTAMAALEEELNRCLSVAPETPEPQSKREMKVIKRQSKR
jgi:hypothetical protein